MITKKLKLTADPGLDVTAFKLPESIECSDVKFPIIARATVRVNWDDIVSEREQFERECKQFNTLKLPPILPTPFRNTDNEYVNKLFIHLMPAIIQTLEKAKMWNYLQKCFFNGVDHIAQLLWNNNPRHPKRKAMNLHIFNMPWVREYLKENPRPLYPKSWLWTEEYAATCIQKTVRQYFVQRDAKVQEMRDFWVKIKSEHYVPDIKSNPFLSKKFAKSVLGPHKSNIISLAEKGETLEDK